MPVTSQIIHFTGYEVPFAQIEAKVPDRRDVMLGHLLGTADMVAQIADRCYLEKCRDRLYAEFVLGGVALPVAANGGRQVKYASGLESAASDPGIRRRSAREAPRWRIPLRLPLPRGPLRRSQSLHGSDRPEHGVPAADPAQRKLAPAAAQSADFRRHRRPDVHHAWLDARLYQTSLVSQPSEVKMVAKESNSHRSADLTVAGARFVANWRPIQVAFPAERRLISSPEILRGYGQAFPTGAQRR